MHNNRSDNEQIKNELNQLYRINNVADQLAIHLSTPGKRKAEPPADGLISISALSGEAIIVLIFSFENPKKAEITNNLRLWVNNEAKKFFQYEEFKKYKNIKIECSTSLDKAGKLQLDSKLDEKTSQTAPEKIPPSQEKKEQTVLRFANNLALITNDITLLDTIKPKSFDEKIVHLKKILLQSLRTSAKQTLPAVRAKYIQAENNIMTVIIETKSAAYDKLREFAKRREIARNRLKLKENQLFSQLHRHSTTTDLHTLVENVTVDGKKPDEKLGFQYDYSYINLDNIYQPIIEKIEKGTFFIKDWSTLMMHHTMYHEAYLLIESEIKSLEKIKSDFKTYSTVQNKIKAALSGIDDDYHFMLLGLIDNSVMKEPSSDPLLNFIDEGRQEQLKILDTELQSAKGYYAVILQYIQTLLNRALSQPEPAAPSVLRARSIFPSNPGKSNSSSKDVEYYDYVGLSNDSSTSEIKDAAKVKIRQLEKKRYYSSNSSAVDTIVPELENSSSNNTISLDITSTTTGKTQTINAICLNNTLNLYISYDFPTATKNKMDLNDFNHFIEIAKAQKILSLNDLGHSGIKIYGIDLVVIKSREHNYKPYHLAFVAHPIQGTNHHVFFAYDLLEHEHEYEEIIKSPKALQEFGDKVRESIRQVTMTADVKNTLAIQSVNTFKKN